MKTLCANVFIYQNAIPAKSTHARDCPVVHLKTDFDRMPWPSLYPETVANVHAANQLG